MENNPKKSKAFIITFILILLLLIAGYYLFKNRENLFGTKGSLSTSKIFSPLLGTSKNKNVKVIDTTDVIKDTNTGATTNTANKKTGTVITDASGNKLVLAEAGEMLKKGDVLYISGFNSNNQPIVMKAIANDRSKSLVFGVAAEDMDKGKMGNVIIEGVLTGIPTNKKEGTLWAVNNTLYLSDKTYGGMTKNSPTTPSFSVPVASVLKVDAVNGSIRIGNITNNKSISAKDRTNLNSYNVSLLKNSIEDLRDYWNSIFGDGLYGGFDYNNGGITIPALNPITPPGGDPYNRNCTNGADNPTLCTTKNGACLNGAINPPSCTSINKNTCNNGADNPTLCTTKNGACLNKATNPPTCTTIDDNSCKIIDENPLTYTSLERKELDDLLRRYYLIASTLKTKDDIALVYAEIAEYKAFMQQMGNLTTQCYAELSSPTYTGPKTQYGNPWYKYENRGPYLTTQIVSTCKYTDSGNSADFNTTTGSGARRDGYVLSGSNEDPFCEPTVGANGDTRPERYNFWNIPAFRSPVDLRDFEVLLNVW